MSQTSMVLHCLIKYIAMDLTAIEWTYILIIYIIKGQFAKGCSGMSVSLPRFIFANMAPILDCLVAL